MATDAYGRHLCDDCLQRQAEHDLIVDQLLLSLCKSCYKDRKDQLKQQDKVTA